MTSPYGELTFSKLREVNVKRSEQVFHQSINDWSVSDWGVAMAGEAGEVCNAIKKLNRHDKGTNESKDPQTKRACIKAIGEELADTIIYADLLAVRLGIDLAEELCLKFNSVSKMKGSNYFL